MSSSQDRFDAARIAAGELSDRLGHHDMAMVLGSGWAAATDGLGTELSQMSSHDLLGVPATTVAGHHGTLRSVHIDAGTGPIRLLVIAGRSHLYEGHHVDTVVHLIRAVVLSGCTRIILTNAAGSLRPSVGVGEVVVISDHLNLTGVNPMVGAAPPDPLPSQFVDLSNLYDAQWRAALTARRPECEEGVYASLLGGSFETPAEIRMLATMGADLVGMSTAPEAIAAHHLGATVLGLSLVTNLAAGLQPHVNHQEVLDAARSATGTLRRVLSDALEGS